jgi:hypothetical protein
LDGGLALNAAPTGRLVGGLLPGLWVPAGQRPQPGPLRTQGRPHQLSGLCRGHRMRPGPSITLELLAGSGSLALSVRGWHSPELAILGAGLFVRAGLTWSASGQPTAPRSRATTLGLPRRLAPLALAAAPPGRKAPPASRRGPTATGPPTRPRSAWTATGSPPSRPAPPRPPAPAPAARSPTTRRPDPTKRAAGRSGPVPASPTNHREDLMRQPVRRQRGTPGRTRPPD